jgi:DHA1 family inner membrane transport protein
MLTKAYEAQCRATKLSSPPPAQERRRGFALFALALGSFVIGTSEFASMGILQIFSADLHITVPVATHAITGYALGVLLGAPIVTLAAAHLNRRTLLLGLMSLFIIANLLSAVATGIGMLAVARFISGLPQGAYFGAGAVVAAYFFGPSQGGRAFALVMTGLTVATIFGAPIATFVGLHLGWRDTYTLVAGLGVLALAALWMWVPQTDELRGSSIGHELSALRKRNVWAMMTVAALSVASIFAVYTFVGPFITDVAQLSIGIVPIALALFGLGMTAGNLIGGRLADAYTYLGLVGGFGTALIVLAILALFGSVPWILLSCLFGVGATMMTAIPTIQVRLTRFAPEAPTLMGAMNLASLNLANALGAWSGGLAIGAGYGLLSAVWAGFALTLAGLLVFAVTAPRAPRLVTAEQA